MNPQHTVFMGLSRLPQGCRPMILGVKGILRRFFQPHLSFHSGRIGVDSRNPLSWDWLINDQNRDETWGYPYWVSEEIALVALQRIGSASSEVFERCFQGFQSRPQGFLYSPLKDLPLLRLFLQLYCRFLYPKSFATLVFTYRKLEFIRINPTVNISFTSSYSTIRFGYKPFSTTTFLHRDEW